MVMEVGAELRIRNATGHMEDWIHENLVVPNPEYQKKKRMGFWTGNTPKVLTMFKIDGDDFIIPFGCLRQVLPIFDEDYDNILPTFKRPRFVDFGGEIPLYDYQGQAVNAMYNHNYGILQSPPGSGKTQMGLAMAAKWGVRTLWLTHTKDLLNQSKERASQYFDKSKFGIISEGKVHIGESITFATVQTLSNVDLTDVKDTWDCIIVDECHRVAGTPTSVTQFSKVLNNLRARHKYGLSATVHRADGLIKCTFAEIGDICYTVPQEAVADKIMSVDILPRRTQCGMSVDMLNTDGTINHAKMISVLGENYPRNYMIVQDLIDNRDHFNLILSDRLEHLVTLMDMLPTELQNQAVFINGRMTSKAAKAEREQAIEDMRRGEKRYLFATYSLAKEGLDIPRLDRLYLTTPQKDYAVIAQSVGRVARTFWGKDQPVVYDYVDPMINLVKTFKKRCTTYRKNGYRILED